jgi:cysteine desulfurase/selenocysteine lyase
LLSFSTPPGAQATTGIPPSRAKSPAAGGSEPNLSGPASTYADPAHSVDQPRPTAPTTAEPRLDSFEFRPEIVPNIGLSKRLFDPHVIKRDFPILQELVHGRPLIWLDNAATTQKPNAVIDRLTSFYRHENSNIHRAAHELAARATDAYEGAREKVRRFLNASSTREIVFVRGATEGINLVAKSWGHRNVQKDDEIVITWLEHHANIVPWQQLAAEKGARLRVAPVDDTGQIILEEYEKLLGPRTRIVAFSQVSNALGTITPAKQIIEMAHRHGARVLVDAAQSVAHMATDVQSLDCDFLVFSGHKIFAPTGVGVVFGKADLLETTPPWQGGGNMIVDVTFERTIYSEPPARFEAGTGTIADAVGLGAALDYLDEIGMANISEYEHELVQYGTAALLTVPGLRLIGTAREKASVLSFVLDSIPPEEVGKALDQEGIAVRAGHHCAQPILRRFGVEKTVRPSLALYNTREDIDALVAALLRLRAGHGSHRP